MIKLLDGPAKGTYACRYAPDFVRAVHHQVTGDWDLLDSPSDRPNANEDIYVYRVVPGSRRPSVHVNMGGSRRGSGFYAVADYRHVEAMQPAEMVRDNEAWLEWCAERSEPSA